MANIKISELNPLLTVEDADVLPIVDNAVTKKVTAAILRTYTQGNSVLLTGAQTIAGIKTFTSQLASTVATGTAPFSVASTTKVTNLNADLLDGLSSADFQATLSGTGIVKSTAGTISYLTDNSTNWNTAFNDKINSAAVTGSGTNTLTLTQQDAGTITATWVNGTLIREIRNNTGATLTKGTIVYISGATGNKPTVSKAIATGDPSSAQTFGFVQNDILNNAEGFVVVIGDLIGLDTSAFTEGDQLYLSATTAGTFTSVKQYAPNHLVYVGIVTRSHPTLGQIEVNIQNGYELDELHNVAAQNPSNGDILQYVTSTGLWTKIAGTTSAISEGSNLYFTNARSRSAISLTTTGTSGAATYNSTTGVLNVPNYADTDTGITSLNGLTALTQTFAVGTSGTDFGISSATSTHTFNLPTASAANRGALSSADWTTFNNKQNALTNPITGTGTTNFLPKFTGASALGNSLLQETTNAIGLNVTPKAWGNNNKVFETTFSTSIIGRSDFSALGRNFFYNSGDEPIYSNNGFANGYFQSNGEHLWVNAPSGTAGNTISFTQAMTLTASGNLLLGTSSNNTGKLQLLGDAYIYKNGEFLANVATNSNQAQFQTWYNSVGATRGYLGYLTNGSNVLSLENTSGGGISFTGAATFSSSVITGADATINGVTVGRGSGNIASNTLVGNGSLISNTTGIQNTALGFQSSYLSTTGVQNTGVGTFSLYGLTTGSNNVAVGRATLNSVGSGSNNTAIGTGALQNNTTSGNTAIGYEAAYSNTSGANITAIGYQALRNSTGGDNTAVGRESLGANTVGAANTAIGYASLIANTSGGLNNAFGAGSLFSNTTGSFNVAMGVSSLRLNIAGSNNIAIGFSALLNNTADNNTAVGYEAGYSNTSGTFITAIGYRALKANTLGYINTAIGYEALSSNTTGYSNTAVGVQSLINNTTGFNNSALGYGTQSNDYSGSVMLGVFATSTASNQFVVGSASVNAGTVATEVNASTKVWNVIINGVAQKILLA
jgi:hypothetical protein